ncbi:MAG: efflux RND transporter periplasmic adaptor subunit [Planctomycetes bacterium]|nr:efflux RND transporter periplasmic adaptor subunit [Planctomycetota bacterium]
MTFVRKPRPATLFALGAVLLLLGACRKEQPQAPQGAGGPVPIVVARPIAREVVEWDRYLGRIEARDSVEVRSRVAGYVTAIHFDEGAWVTAGDKLFDIDRRPLAAAVARAEAELQRARAQLEVARAQHLQAKAGLAEVEARKRQFEALLDLATKRSQRAERAVKGNAIAEETVDVRQSELQQAQANLEAVVAEIESKKAAVATAAASVSAADSAIAAGQAALDLAEVDLSYCELRAPISGRIGRELVDVGNFVGGGAQGATVLATIVSGRAVHCYFDADERALLRFLRLDGGGESAAERLLGNPAFLALADEKGFPHQGCIDFVDNRVDQATGTIRVRAVLDDPQGLLLPGLFATVAVPASKPATALFIPDAAIVADQSDRYVWVVAADGSLGRHDVELGPIIAGLRMIRAGIEAESKVVIRGLQRIRPGLPLAPQEEALPPFERDDGLPDGFERLPRERWPGQAKDEGQPR